jgi:hypothetical protein
VRSIAVRADPLYRGTIEAADVVVSDTAIGYRFKDSASIAHRDHMSREALLDLVVVASRLLDAWEEK